MVGLSREVNSYSHHQCCCRLNKRVMQSDTTRQSTGNNSSSATLTSTVNRLKRLRANDRERNRMHALNLALARLRDVLPTGNGFTRHSSSAMSKIATLRAAQSYIRMLSSLLAELESHGDKGSKVAGARWNILSSTNRQHSTCIGVAFQQPEVAYDDVIRDRPTALSDYSVSRQMSLIDQHAVNLYSSHSMVSYVYDYMCSV